MLLCRRIAQDDRPAWETQAHTPWRDGDGNKCLRPVYLVYRCGGDEDLADEEEESGEEEHVADFGFGEQDAGCDRGEEARDSNGSVLGTSSEGGVASDDFDEIPEVVAVSLLERE